MCEIFGADVEADGDEDVGVADEEEFGRLSVELP